MIRAILVALAISAGVVTFYLDEGGGDYTVAKPPDPCKGRERVERAGVTATFQRLGLFALDGAACELGVTRERLILSLSGNAQLPEGATRERRTEAVRAGLLRAVDEEEKAGKLSPAQAALFKRGIEILPIDALIDQLFGGRGG